MSPSPIIDPSLKAYCAASKQPTKKGPLGPLFVKNGSCAFL